MSMPLLSQRDAEVVRTLFAESLTRDVRLLVFSEEASQLVIPGRQPCLYCKETERLVEEVAGLSERLSVEVFRRATHPDQFRQYGVDRVPAVAPVVAGGEGGAGEIDYGVRFFGIPIGLEFRTFVDVIGDVSQGETDLARETREFLAGLAEPVHLQVFVTLTCPYCPRAVRLAHQFAIAGESVRAEMVDAQEFLDLAERYQVMGVPKTVINGSLAVEGAVPEAVLLEAIRQALGRDGDPTG